MDSRRGLSKGNFDEEFLEIDKTRYKARYYFFAPN
jgi:hypothetical protein